MTASAQNGLGNLSNADDTEESTISSSDSSLSHAKGRAESFESLPESYQSAANALASGIKTNYVTELQKAKLRVGELVHNQDVLRESIQQELTNLQEYRLTEDVTKFVQDLKLYQTKLSNIKKDIQYVTDKVSKMKKRAVKLQINKQKEELHKAQQKQKEMELQKQLTAKPASSASS